MPRNPQVYRSNEAPFDPTQGDLLVRNSDNAVRVYNGSTWVAFRSTSLTLTDAASVIVPGATSLSLRNNADSADNLILTDAGAGTFRSTVTATGVQTSAGFASTNAATPGFYIPGAAGVPTGAVASLAGRSPMYFDTTNNRIWMRNGGSWFATASLVLGG